MHSVHSTLLQHMFFFHCVWVIGCNCELLLYFTVADTEDDIITVEAGATERSSFSEDSTSSTHSHGFADNVGDEAPELPSSARQPTADPSLILNRPQHRPSDNSLLCTQNTSKGHASFSGSLKDYVFWTPERSDRQGIGRRIIDSVLDEQPLFIDSPTAEVDSCSPGVLRAFLHSLVECLP